MQKAHNIRILNVSDWELFVCAQMRTVYQAIVEAQNLSSGFCILCQKQLERHEATGESASSHPVSPSTSTWTYEPQHGSNLCSSSKTVELREILRQPCSLVTFACVEELICSSCLPCTSHPSAPRDGVRTRTYHKLVRHVHKTQRAQLLLLYLKLIMVNEMWEMHKPFARGQYWSRRRAFK